MTKLLRQPDRPHFLCRQSCRAVALEAGLNVSDRIGGDGYFGFSGQRGGGAGGVAPLTATNVANTPV
jgi:hypothetical protein